MPEILVILLSIMAVALTLAALYGLWLLRKMLIVSKKLDYLVEDITYKSEMLSPLIDSLLKLASYIDVMEIIVKQNSEDFKRVIDNNRPSINRIRTQLEKIIDEK